MPSQSQVLASMRVRLSKLGAPNLSNPVFPPLKPAGRRRFLRCLLEAICTPTYGA